MTCFSDLMQRPVVKNRREVLALGAGAFAMPFIGPVFAADAAPPSDRHFRALRRGVPIGTHAVLFRTDGDRLLVDTHIDISVKILFFTVFRLKHEAQEVWQSGRLMAVKSVTERDGIRLQVSGMAIEDGFRIVGEDGPFLAAAGLLTSNSLWDNRIVREARLIDVQYGGEVGLIAKPLGYEQVATPQGVVHASRYQIITPHYAGSVFYDAEQRWVKTLIETDGEIIEYALAT